MIFSTTPMRWKFFLKFSTNLLLFILGLSGIIFFAVNYVEKSREIAQLKEPQPASLTPLTEESATALPTLQIPPEIAETAEMAETAARPDLIEIPVRIERETLSKLIELREIQNKTIFFYQDNNYAVRLFSPINQPRINFFSKIEDKLILKKENPNEKLSSSNDKTTYIYKAITKNITYIISINIFKTQPRISLIIEQNQIE